MVNDKHLVFELRFCRMCKGKRLKKVISLSSTPPANAFLTKEYLQKKEHFFPLDINFCLDCGQLQLTHVVSPKLLFTNYVYVSSTSPVFIAHFEEYAKNLIKRFRLNKQSFVIDIGSNDGILLNPLQKAGIKVLGVDPAVDIAKKATKEGIKTLPYFLNTEISKTIVKKFGQADVITANNAFAHINDLDEIIKSIKILIKEDSVFVIEFPYLIDFIKKNLFDTIYHEHLSYLSLRPLIALFKRFDMEIFDAKKVNSHGGSLRVYVKKINNNKYKVKKNIQNLLCKETACGLNNIDTYLKFTKKIEDNKEKLILLLQELKLQRKVIVGYGAPAKGNTLLNYYKIGPETLDYIVDDSTNKQGLFTPGTHIPVVPFSKIVQSKPDYIFILAWNFATPLMNRLASFKEKGGHFIIPIPKVTIV